MKLEDLKKLCDEATPGPWFFDKEGGPEHEGNGHGAVWFDGPHGRTAVFDSCYWDMADAKLAAAARTYLPKLIAVAEAARVVCSEDPNAPDHEFDHEPVQSSEVPADMKKLARALAALEADP